MQSFKQNYIGTPQSINWDEYFMLQALIASYKSKDPSTKVGCVIVDQNNHQISMGYNGFVAGIDESQLPWGDEPGAPLEHQKHAYVVHAEANAIMHATKSVEQATVYITLFPCNECAKLLASSQVKEVIYLKNKDHKIETNRITKKILGLSGINFRNFKLAPDVIEGVNTYLKQTNDLTK